MTARAWTAICVISTAIAIVVSASAGPVAQSAQTKPTTQTKPAARAKPAPVKLPAAVEAAFTKAYPNATIKNVSKEKENGVEQYEVESMDGAQRRDLIYKPDGTLVEYEEVVPEASVPAAVVAAVKARYPKATITRYEKLFKGGTMNYELGLKGAKAGEVVLTPDGKWVSPK